MRMRNTKNGLNKKRGMPFGESRRLPSVEENRMLLRYKKKKQKLLQLLLQHLLLKRLLEIMQLKVPMEHRLLQSQSF